MSVSDRGFANEKFKGQSEANLLSLFHMVVCQKRVPGPDLDSERP